MFSEIAVKFQNVDLKKRDVEGIALSTIFGNQGIAILSREEAGIYILDIYTLFKDETDNCFTTKENVAILSFVNRNELLQFVSEFPKMTAVDLLIFLNQRS